MPEEYRTAIDLGIKTGEETIENALEIMKKMQRTKRANDKEVSVHEMKGILPKTS